MASVATHKAHLVRDLKIGGIILVAALGVALLLLTVKWPFTREETIKSLEQISLSEVRISSFDRLFFPRPGYIATGVTFARGPSHTPLAKIDRIICHSGWLALITFTHRIHLMELEGLQVEIPKPLLPPVRKHPPAAIRTTVTTLVANGTVVQIPRGAGSQRTRFDFPELVLRNVGSGKTIHLETRMHNPSPPGELRVSGAVGPLSVRRAPETPLSGTFRFLNADLSTFRGIAGTLTASGQFKGTLARAEVTGKAGIPDFELTSAHHPIVLRSEYRVLVNGIRGDVTVESVHTHLLNTDLAASGSLTGTAGKTLSLDLESTQARIEDLLRLFAESDPPALAGPIRLRAHVMLPPEHRPFIHRVRLDGDFAIDDADFTASATQDKVDQLSARARGHKNEVQRVAENLIGKVRLRDGLATLSSTAFAVPGAVAKGEGTYNIPTGAVDFHGQLAMHVTLSKAVGGLKSILLLPLDPFFKKSNAGAVVPVAMTGTYQHPVFKVSLRK